MYKGWIWALFIGLDQLGNAISGGHPDVTISARIGRNFAAGRRPLWWWRIMRNAVDWAFSPIEDNHCVEAWAHTDELGEGYKVRRGTDFGLLLMSLILLGFVPSG